MSWSIDIFWYLHTLDNGTQLYPRIRATYRWTTDKCQGDIGNEWDKDGLSISDAMMKHSYDSYGKKNWTHPLDTADTHPSLLKDLNA